MDLLSWVTKVGEVVSAIVAIVAIAAIIWAARKYALFKVQTDAIETLQTGLQTEKDRGDRLERELKDVREEGRRRDEEYAKAISDLRAEIARKEGVIEGRGHTIVEMYRAAVESGGCDDAFKCDHRSVPGQSAFDAVATPEN